MKKKTKIRVERWETGPCTTTARQIMRMECGLAFATHQLDKHRIEKAGIRSIARSDIEAGLLTTQRLAKGKLVEGDWDPRARPYLKKAFAGTTRVLNIVRNGPEKISVKDAEELRQKVAVVETLLRDAWRQVRAHCNA